ncbi:MAG: 30S ribosome-binding factor RbfA [Desulfarculus sp.]|nr:30S ribosome-binding factor RbfA [Desulfarculus sp.]
MGTRRTERLGNLILAELADLLLKRVKDPRLAGMTLTGVDVSPDLSQAKIYFSLLDAGRRGEVEAGFQAAAPFLRRELATRLAIKTTPRLVLAYDASLVRGAEMERLIRQVRQADQEQAQARGDAPEGEGTS